MSKVVFFAVLACVCMALCGCPSTAATRENDAVRAANNGVREMDRETKR
jgi:hypothetical protein